MAQVKDLTELTLRDRWAEVKAEDGWWGDLTAAALRGVKHLLEAVMEVELLEGIRAGRYRRTELRRGYRNGYRERSLLTQWGLLQGLRVPRDREGHYQPSVLPAYQRRQEAINRMVREAFLTGVSTRKVKEVIAPILGASLSAQTVSRIVRSLDAEVQCYHSRPLADSYRYLFLNGLTLKVKLW